MNAYVLQRWGSVLVRLWWQWLHIDLTVSHSLVAEIDVARAWVELGDLEDAFDFGDESP